MSKLIVNTGTLSSGGAERVLSILSKPFADAFDEVQYVMWLDDKYPDIFYEIDSRVRIVCLSKESGTSKTLRKMLWFRKYVKKEKPDVVLSFMIALCLTVTISLLFSGVPQIVSLRNDPHHMKRKWLRKLASWSFYVCDVKGIIVQTETIRNFFESKKRLYKKTKVIANPIDIDAKMVGVALQHIKENKIVCVGRLSRQKQPWVLIEAFAMFLNKHPSYQLVFYGEGELRNELISQAKQLEIENKVLFPGRSKDVLKSIIAAQMFVMTSMNEGMSNALIEAMCVGLPCISTKVSGAIDIIKDGENGFLVEIGDVNGIADKMSQLANNINLRNSMGVMASQLYEQLSCDKISKEWIEYLKAI